MVDERLDEISRAIVATSVSNPAGFEAADIQRLEGRRGSVIESVTKDRRSRSLEHQASAEPLGRGG